MGNILKIRKNPRNCGLQSELAFIQPSIDSIAEEIPFPYGYLRTERRLDPRHFAPRQIACRSLL